MVSTRRTRLAFAIGLVCLIAGMGMLDRGFTKWRNDPRSFPYADGTYPTSADTDPALRSRFADKRLLKTSVLSGVGLLLASIVLFGMYPLETERDDRSEES